MGSVRDVIVERWTIDDLDFLELSIRSDTVADAPAAQQELERAVGALSLQPSNDDKSKTDLSDLSGWR